MNRTLKVLLASLITLSSFSAPAHAEAAILKGAVTATKDLGFAGVVLSLEEFNSDTDEYTIIATATPTPSPSPTSTRAPYTFSDVQDGTYRVSYNVDTAAVGTSRFSVSSSTQFTVVDGSISVNDAPVSSIPDFRLNAMGKYYVQALDSGTGEPVPNAVFTISGYFNGAPATFAALTEPNELGTAILPVPGAGSFSVRSSDPTGLHQSFTYDERDFTSGFSNAAEAELFMLQEAGKLVFTVTSNAGKDKVSGALVRVYRGEELVEEVFADSTGVARVQGLVEGDYLIYAGGPVGSVLKDSAPVSVSIFAGTESEASANLASGLTISGTVSAADGPVANARIEVFQVDADGNEVEMSPTQAGSDGRYTTNGLGAGTYNLYFYDEVSQRQQYRQFLTVQGVVVTTRNLTGINAVLPSASLISGKVTSEAGAGISEVSVELVSQYGEVVSSTVTDAFGRYQFAKVSVGKYTLKFSHSQYGVLYSSEFTAAADQLSTQNAVLVSGSEISGLVRLTDGAGIEGLKVSLHPASGSGLNPVATTFTEVDGTYRFGGVVPGTYRIQYDGTATSQVVGTFWQGEVGAEENPASFTLAADIIASQGVATTRVNPVPVVPWQQFTGTVRNVDVGIPSATVRLLSVASAQEYSADTDENGIFTISAPEGDYRVAIKASGFASGYVGAVDDQPVMVALPSSAEILTFSADFVSFPYEWSMSDWSIDLSGVGGTVKISVVDEVQDPVSAGVVVAYDEQGVAVAYTDAADDNGDFVLGGLRGKYYFSFEQVGSYAKRYLGNTAKLSDSGTLSLTVASGKTYAKTITTVALPELTVRAFVDGSAGAAPYQGDVTVEVYVVSGATSTLNEDLSTSLSDGVATFGVQNGATYRIRLVPDDQSLTPVWVGEQPLALTAQDASIVTIPATGKAPTLGNVALNRKAGRISGELSDDIGGAIFNAEVQLLSSTGAVLQSVTTREDGMYNFYRISSGFYTLKFSSEQFAARYVRNVFVSDGETKSIYQVLNISSGITGQMLDINGLPVSGANVSLYKAEGSGITPLQIVKTQAQGLYIFTGIPTGSYKIKFDGRTADIPTSTFWYGETSSDSFATAGIVQTTVGEILKDINPEPAQTWARIQGTLLNGSNPVAGAVISLITVSSTSNDGQVAVDRVTNEFGRYSAYVAAGTYRIRVQAPGFATSYVAATEEGEPTLVASSASAALAIVEADTVAIDGGLMSDDLTLSLSGNTGSVTVEVKDSAGKSVTEGELYAYDVAGQVAGYSDQAIAGSFTIAGLSGTYRLSFESGGLFAETFYGGGSSFIDPLTKSVAVSRTVKPTVEIQVKTLPKLSVKVVDDSVPAVAYKRPVVIEVYSQIAGIWVLDESLGGLTSAGTVSFGVASGASYRIRVVPSDPKLTPVWVGASRLAKDVHDASSIAIPKVGAAPTLDNVVLDSYAGNLQGSLTDLDGNAIANASIQLLDAAGELVATASTSEDGSYSFAQIVPGEYTVRFAADGYALRYSGAYTIAAGGTQTLDAQLDPASGISGTVLAEGQQGLLPIVGGVVKLFSASGTGLTPIQTLRTDANGQYNFIGVKPGSYKLYFDNSQAANKADSYWYGEEENVLSFKMATSVIVALGSVSADVNPQAGTSWTTFKGSIVDRTRLVSGVKVELVGPMGVGLYSAISDERGAFFIAAPDGDYRVRLSASGYQDSYVDATEEGATTLTSSLLAASILSISAGAATFSDITDTEVLFNLSAVGGKIAVTVKDADGKLVDGGYVTVYDKSGRIVARAEDSIAGIFTIVGLRGSYRLSYEQPGVFAETFIGDSLSIGAVATKTITVVDADSLQASITAKSLQSLVVNIYGAGQTAYRKPVFVEVYALSNGQWILNHELSVETSQGSLTLGVDGGQQYRIRLVPTDPNLAPSWVASDESAITVGSAKSIVIPLTGAVPSVSGTLTVAAGTVTGSIQDSTGSLVPGAVVALLASDGTVVARSGVREDGAYRLPQVRPGMYSIKVSFEGYADKTVPGLNITAGQLMIQDPVLEAASGISGQVLGFASGDPASVVPIAGGVVGLYAEDSRGLAPVRTAVTDLNGYYNFANVVPGRYRVRIDATEAQHSAGRVWYGGADSNVTSFADAVTLDAVRGELIRDLDPAPLELWAEFAGVVQAGELPISGATVSLHSSEGQVRSATTDSGGFIRMYAPAGNYKVKINAPGYPSGYVSEAENGVILDPLEVNATVLRVQDGVASFDSGLNLLTTPLDLTVSGGKLQVQVADGSTVLTEGHVTIYDRSGKVVSVVTQAVGGVYAIEGLIGEYAVSYADPGRYEVSFLGGGKSVNDAANSLVKIRDKSIVNVKVAALALPKFTVSIKSGNAVYAQPVAVNVYQSVGTKWTLAEDLSGSTLTGTYTFGVERGKTYRVQAVPADVNVSAAWVGSATAFSVEGAPSYTMPLTGVAPTLPSVALVSGLKVTVPIKNARSEGLENVTARLEVTQGGEFVEFARKNLGSLDAGALGTLTFTSVPTSLLPVRVTVGSSETAAVVWTSGTANADVTADLIELSEAAMPASVAGRIRWTDQQALVTSVSLVTDEGDIYATTDTLETTGDFVFEDVPLGVHFTVVPNLESGFATTTGSPDFTAQSGQTVTVDFEIHHTVLLSGRVLDSAGEPRSGAAVTLYRVAGANFDPKKDDFYTVYSDENGDWSFDGSADAAEVGKYAIYVNGADTDSTPRYFGDLSCVAPDLAVEVLAKCGALKAESAALLATDETVTSISDIGLVLGEADSSAPSSVKLAKSPASTTTVTPIWQWSGLDLVDGKALRSEVVVAKAAYGAALSKWSNPIDLAGTTYTLPATRGYTYCLSVRMIDKSNNASAFTSPSCTTVVMDDASMKPLKTASWSKVSVKSAYLGKVTAAKKNVKGAVLNVASSSVGTSLCIYYVTGVKFGSFNVLVGGKKIGKTVATAGKSGVVKSVCISTKLTAKSKISIAVPVAGSGVQIDGFAILPARPATPKIVEEPAE